MREVIEYKTEEEWLALRLNDLTSTEVAGLFGAGAYEGSRTPFELFQIKAGLLQKPEFKGSDRTVWGNRLEAAIAAGIAEDCGVIAVPYKNYVRIPEVRLGASFDWRIVGLAEGFKGDQSVRDMFKEHGPGNLEVKNIDSLQFKRNWIADGDVIEATPQIEFQTQGQMEVADLGWTLLAPLVGGNTPRPVIRLRDKELGAMIVEKAAELWDRIARGAAPEPDFQKDAGVISSLYALNNGTELDMSDNNRLAELCANRKRASDAESAAKDAKDAATAEILTLIGGAKKVKAASGFTISASTVEEKFVEGYLRKAYRSVRVTHKAA